MLVLAAPLLAGCLERGESAVTSTLSQDDDTFCRAGGTIKKIADGEPWTMPATIEDPKVLDEIGNALKGRV